MNVVVVGTGYVGLVTGACLAERGNKVTCIDIDEKKIAGLGNGIIPIYEPGLDELVESNAKEGRLEFATNFSKNVEGTDVIFIAVGTPSTESGSPDLQYVKAVAREIGKHLVAYTVIVDKSTVPIGTANIVREIVSKELAERKLSVEFDVVSNPEFLKEGNAIADFMKPDRVVIGSNSEKAREIMKELYQPFVRNHQHIVCMGIKDAEMTKYAANSMLATKISFMNEIANLCDVLGIDVENVRQGIGLDSRIGFSFIYPGCGYGGSCFPKDVQALIQTAKSVSYDAIVLEAVEQRNNKQKLRLVEKILQYFGEDLEGKVFGLWGLAFKPGTDDMREAPSKVVLRELIERGALIQAYDPVAADVAKKELPGDWLSEGRLVMKEHQYDALDGVDAMILVTEWKPFNNPDFRLMKRLMKGHIVFDGRNQYEPSRMKKEGFKYFTIGRDLIGV